MNIKKLPHIGSGVFLLLVACYANAGDQQAAAAEPPHSLAETPAKIDPAHPARIGRDFYPRKSVLAREEGRCLVRVTILANGETRDASLTQSTGYPRLDQACLHAFVPGHFIPATQDGKPVQVTLVIPINWAMSH